jgi:hypothetical protein
MNNYRQIINWVETRNSVLTPELKNIQNSLQTVLEGYRFEAGVINRGYFSYFLPILNNSISARIIESFNISEEGFSDGLSGTTIQLPVVDVFHKGHSYRIFLKLF